MLPFSLLLQMKWKWETSRERQTYKAGDGWVNWRAELIPYSHCLTSSQIKRIIDTQRIK